jgi:hypothetical protein
MQGRQKFKPKTNTNKSYIHFAYKSIKCQLQQKPKLVDLSQLPNPPLKQKKTSQDDDALSYKAQELNKYVELVAFIRYSDRPCRQPPYGRRPNPCTG